jgi:hypothetical protein
MKIVLLFIASAATIAALAAQNAQDKPAVKPEPSKAEFTKADSVIPLDIRARWWRAVAEQADAQSAAQQKAAVSQSIVEEMTKFCGDRTLIRNAKGEPDCVAAEKPAEKPAEKKP